MKFITELVSLTKQLCQTTKSGRFFESFRSSRRAAITRVSGEVGGRVKG